jgi:hypothetical protein
MSRHNAGNNAFGAPEQTDPGDAGKIGCIRSPGVFPLVSVAAETRTVVDPTRAGALMLLYMRTDGGDITVTFSTAYTEGGTTTFVFSDPGQFILLVSVYDGTNYYWRKVADHGTGNLTLAQWTALASLSAAELGTLDNQTLTTGAGAGITDGTGTIYKNAVENFGGIFKTTIIIDLTGLASSTTDLDIIGTGTSPAYIALLSAAQNGGTILAIQVTCLEAPAGGIADIDLYSATEGTGKFDDAVAATLTETALITAGGNWTNGLSKGATVAPLSTEYLYLTGGAGGTAAVYTAGKFKIEILGY